MTESRRRVSLSLTEQEYEQLNTIADYLGIKATSAAHRALTRGLSVIFSEGQSLKTSLDFMQINEAAKVKRLKEMLKTGKSVMSVQRKQNAKKKKSR